jgi:DNA-binding CsgD family transcriptional regulator/tetratricopeptide (TPR) repeat protein
MQLLERTRCLADLAEWLAAAAERSGCIALVAGEAGIGKTSLLQEFVKQQRGTRVLWGACDALFTPRPLAPLHDISRQTQGALSKAVNSGANRDVLFNTALDELERSAALVVLEDMHWADEATLDLFKFLGRRIHRTHSMLVATYRDDEVGAHHPLRLVIGDLPRANIQRMPLSPLSEPAVAQLARQAGRSSKGLHALTGGNPLFVTELLAAAAECVPATVSDAVLARVNRLPSAAREIAELVCTVPGKTEDWLLEQAAPPDEASLESCLGIGMVRHEDGALAFRHELTRRALEDSLSEPRRRGLHAKILAILAQRPEVPAARLAHHADGARNPEAVLRFAPTAASQAASVGSHREAASHYEAALRYAVSLGPQQRAQLLELLAYEYYLTDQIERAIEARRSTLAIWRACASRVKEGDTLRWLSRLSWFAGRRTEASQYADEAIATLEALPPGPELAMAYSNRAQLDMLSHEAESAIEWARRAIALAQPRGSDEIVSHALNNLGTARIVAGDSSGWADLERSLQLARAHSLQEHVARAYTNLSSMAVTERIYPPAMQYLSEGLAYCEEHDLDSWRLYMLAWRARARFELGDWQGASDDAATVSQHPRTAPISRIPALTVLGHLRVRRGDPDASSPLEEVRALAAQTQELQRLAPLASALADAASLAGDRETVIREVQPVYDLASERPDAWLKGELAAWLWREGALEQPPTDIAEPYALEISGDWRGAAHAWAALGCPYERASMLAWYGTETEQREALAVFEQLGAGPAAQKLRRQLRARGVRAIPRGSRSSTRNNEHGLTKREAEVLQLLSQGLRNAAIAKRLYLSTKTIDHHVSAILTKLRVSSRAQAIAMTRKDSGEGASNGRRKE